MDTQPNKYAVTRFPNGVIQAWSARSERVTWGYDIRVDGKRLRMKGLQSKEEADHIVSRLKFTRQCANAGVDPDFDTTVWADSNSNIACKIGAVGATGELLVAADLLRQGFDVFRSVASNAACDLIALMGNRLCRIEVKCAVIDKHGRVRFKHLGFDPAKHDVLALVFLKDCRIEYRPTLASWIDPP